MTQIPPPIPPFAAGSQNGGLTESDRAHLNTLGICYYVFAGLNCLGICGGLIYMIGGIVFMVAPVDQSGSQDLPPAALGGFFVVIGAVILALAGALAWLYYKTGKHLREGYGKTLCQVMAAISLLSVPLGTILGIFTFVVLSRPQVSAYFDANRRGV